MSERVRCPEGHEWETSSEVREERPHCPVCGQAGATTVSPAPATAEREPPATAWPVIPGYEIRLCLGGGGMGVVYLAWQPALKRRVAIKMLRAGDRAGPDERARFRREAEAIARVQHPNIIPVYDIGEVQGRPYFVMEYLEGGTLARPAAAGIRGHADIARLVETLARAMHHAHGCGVLHRDLKPANILLTAQGAPKIADFGLAKKLDDQSLATSAGAVLGTPGYMPPEQAWSLAKRPGEAADVYGLGAILYDLLTGQPPFVADTMPEFLRQVLADDPVPPRRLRPQVPFDLETICLKCLEKKPGRRYPSALALADDLARFQRTEPIRARPPGPVGRLTKWVERRPLAAALVGVIALALAVLLGGSLWANARLSAERDRKERNFQHALRANQFLVTELAPRLKPIAFTRSRTVEEILNQATDRYRELLEDDQSPPVRAGWGELLNLSADLYLDMNNTAAALHGAEEALGVFRQLVREDPAARRYQAGMAESQEVLGRVYMKRGSLPAALTAFQDSCTLREQLLAADADNPRWRYGLSTGLYFNADVLALQGDDDRARELRERASSLRRQLAEAQPDNDEWQAGVAHAYEKTGDDQFYQHPEAARESYQAAATILEKLTGKDPMSTDWQRAYLRVTTSLGQVYRAMKKGGEAEEQLQKAAALARRFLEFNPDSIYWKLSYARVQLQLIYPEGLKDDETRPVLENRLKLLDEIIAFQRSNFFSQDPENVEWKAQLAGLQMQEAYCLMQLAQLAKGAGTEWTRAEERLQEAVRLQTALVQRDATNVDWARRLNSLHMFLGMVLKAHNKPAESLAAYQAYHHGRLVLGEYLVRTYPDVSRWRDELKTNLDDAQHFLTGEALAYYDDPARTAPRLPLLSGLADVYESLAEVFRLQGQADRQTEALGHAQRLRRLAEQVQSHPFPAGKLSVPDRLRRIEILEQLVRINPESLHRPAGASIWGRQLVRECRGMVNDLAEAPEGGPAEEALARNIQLLRHLLREGKLPREDEDSVRGIEQDLARFKR